MSARLHSLCLLLPASGGWLLSLAGGCLLHLESQHPDVFRFLSARLPLPPVRTRVITLDDFPSRGQQSSNLSSICHFHSPFPRDLRLNWFWRLRHGHLRGSHCSVPRSRGKNIACLKNWKKISTAKNLPCGEATGKEEAMKMWLDSIPRKTKAHWRMK